MMRYVMRDEAGAIVSVHREPVPNAQPLEDGHPEVMAFLDGDENAQSFAGLDADLVRVLEDLIDALIDRNVLRVTDLPAQAQQKLFARKHFRSRAQARSLNLFGSENGDMGVDLSNADTGMVHFDNA
jgi:hypothetical protein